MIRKLAKTIGIAFAMLLAVLYALSTTWPDPELWHETLRINLDGPFYLSRLVKRRDNGQHDPTDPTFDNFEEDLFGEHTFFFDIFNLDVHLIFLSHSFYCLGLKCNL